MFSKKGQSALEYLMTYGWALIVIVIVIGALMLLVGDPSGDSVSCSPSAGSFLYEDLSYSSGTFNLVLTNGTGSTLSANAVQVNTGTVGNDNNYSSIWTPGTKATFTVTGMSADVDTSNQSTITITWTGSSGLPHSETKTCTVA